MKKNMYPFLFTLCFFLMVHSVEASRSALKKAAFATPPPSAAEHRLQTLQKSGHQSKIAKAQTEVVKEQGATVTRAQQGFLGARAEAHSTASAGYTQKVAEVQNKLKQDLASHQAPITAAKKHLAELDQRLKAPFWKREDKKVLQLERNAAEHQVGVLERKLGREAEDLVKKSQVELQRLAREKVSATGSYQEIKTGKLVGPVVGPTNTGVQESRTVLSNTIVAAQEKLGKMGPDVYSPGRFWQSKTKQQNNKIKQQVERNYYKTNIENTGGNALNGERASLKSLPLPAGEAIPGTTKGEFGRARAAASEAESAKAYVKSTDASMGMVPKFTTKAK